MVKKKKKKKKAKKRKPVSYFLPDSKARLQASSTIWLPEEQQRRRLDDC